ncbi:PAS domain-containing protein [Dongia sp.]|uniref:PAS domain-containing protein n=1 Tax=Dongia sp. TaxID=1977262 RepID=UPI00374FF33B
MPLRNSVDELASDKVKSLHDWWRAALDGAGRIPDRRDFDPTRFARLLPNLIIAEVERDPFRIRYRLVGTKVADVLNIDFTGRYLDELIDGATDTPWQDYFVTAFEQRVPILGEITERTLSGGTFIFEFGIFPVTAGGAAVGQFLCIEDYFDFNLTSAELIPWSLRDAKLSA